MYFFYVDETGNLDPDVSGGKDYLFVLTAVGLFDQRWKKFYHYITRKKRAFIEDIYNRTGRRLDLSECEVKSNWIRIEKERESRFFLKSLTVDELSELSKSYFDQIDYHNMCLISIIIDKRELDDFMDQNKLHRKAWELMCERIEMYMKERHSRHKAVIITDDVSRQANVSLAMKHAYFLEFGTSSGCRLHHVLEMPLFVRSELAEGVQLADLCSYCFYHAFRYEKYDYEYLRLISFNVYNSENTSEDKFDGLKVFPETSPLVAGCPECFK